MRHTPPPCGHCTHWNYLMSCEVYDVFVADHDGRCAICRRLGSETGHGFLCIDHDPPVGQWAVRGLLCSSCNGRLSVSPAWRPEAEVYLAYPWYKQWFAERGISITPATEPPVGTTVQAGNLPWQHTKKGWVCQLRTGPWRTFSWEELNKYAGPHRIAA